MSTFLGTNTSRVDDTILKGCCIVCVEMLLVVFEDRDIIYSLLSIRDFFFEV